MHTTYNIINKLEKLEHTDKVIFDIPFMIQSMKKILEALQIYQLTSTAKSSQIPQIMAELAVLVSWYQILKGSRDFLHILCVAVYNKWDGFTYELIFFIPISDGLGDVTYIKTFEQAKSLELSILVYQNLKKVKKKHGQNGPSSLKWR